MLKKLFLLLVFSLMLTDVGFAQTKGVGIGVILGEPSGVSFKAWNGPRAAVDAALAWSFEGENALQIHLDQIFHDFDLFKVDRGILAFYYGFGGRTRIGDEFQLALRVPLGINYLFADAPVDLFFEIVPLLDLIPNTDVDVNGGIGVRYFFR